MAELYPGCAATVLISSRLLINLYYYQSVHFPDMHPCFSSMNSQLNNKGVKYEDEEASSWFGLRWSGPVRFPELMEGQGPVIDVTSCQKPALTSGKAVPFFRAELVKLGGKINHFGMDITQSRPVHDYMPRSGREGRIASSP
jgi:hypothetical protein